MYRLTALFLFLALLASLQAQDRIITVKKDTIPCRIISIQEDRILYEINETKGNVKGMFIDMSQVASYIRATPTTHSTRRIVERTNPVIADEPGWNIQLSVGKSYMPWYWDVDQTIDTKLDYYRQIETGYQLDASAVYWMTEHFGFGLDYSFYTSGFHGDVVTPVGTNLYATASERFNQYVHYFGPSFQFLQYLDKQHAFTLNESISAGAFAFRLEDQTSLPIIQQSGYTNYSVNTLMTASNLAAKIGLTAGYRLTQNLTIGIGGAFTYATFDHANLTMRNPDNITTLKNRELSRTFQLSRLDYSLVVRYQY